MHFKCSVQRQFCEITFTLGYNNWNRHCKSGLVLYIAGVVHIDKRLVYNIQVLTQEWAILARLVS